MLSSKTVVLFVITNVFSIFSYVLLFIGGLGHISDGIRLFYVEACSMLQPPVYKVCKREVMLDIYAELPHIYLEADALNSLAACIQIIVKNVHNDENISVDISKGHSIWRFYHTGIFFDLVKLSHEMPTLQIEVAKSISNRDFQRSFHLAILSHRYRFLTVKLSHDMPTLQIEALAKSQDHILSNTKNISRYCCLIVSICESHIDTTEHKSKNHEVSMVCNLTIKSVQHT